MQSARQRRPTPWASSCPRRAPSDVDALANHLGVPVEGISGYTSQSSWGAIGSYQPPATGLRLYLGVAMSPSNSSPAQTPANLGVYQQLAQNLVNGGQPYAIVRIGWEWSTTYFSWGVQNTTPAQYVTAFDDIVTTMRSVPGQHFFFDWCAAADTTPTNGSYAASYPGDQFVDYIGTDQYDNPGYSWTATLDTVGGLAYTVNFAKAHGKFASVPEWGLNGSDDAAFVNDMYGFITNPNNDVGVQLVLLLRRSRSTPTSPSSPTPQPPSATTSEAGGRRSSGLSSSSGS